jgi:hypothetical protein
MMDDLLFRLQKDIKEMKARYGLRHDKGSSLYCVEYNNKIIGRYKGIEATVELLIGAENENEK